MHWYNALFSYIIYIAGHTNLIEIFARRRRLIIHLFICKKHNRIVPF